MRILLLIILSQIKLMAIAQNVDLVDVLLERITEYDENEFADHEELRNSLEFYLRNPLLVNRSKEDDIRLCPLFNSLQAEELIHHRSEYGALLDLSEFTLLAHFDLHFIRALKPFISLEQRLSDISNAEWNKGMKQEIRIMVKTSLPKSKAYLSQPAQYPGIPISMNLAYSASIGRRLSWNLRIDQDAGEAFRTSGVMKLDHVSSHIWIKDVGRINHLVFGDFKIHFGQGLSLSNAYGPSRAGWVSSIKPKPGSVQGFRSSSEVGYFRGLALDLAVFKQLDLILFGSFKKTDGTIRYSDNGILISSLDEGQGLHRSLNERTKMDQIKQYMLGSFSQLSLKRTNLAFLVKYSVWNHPLLSVESGSKKYDINGNFDFSSAISYDTYFKSVNLFGELSYDRSLAQVHGILYSAGKTDCSILWRYYPPEFVSIHGNAISATGGLANENGLFLAIDHKVHRSFSVHLHTDLYHSPWMKFSIDVPSSGKDIWAETQWKINRDLEIICRLKHNSAEKQYQLTALDAISERQRTTLRVHLNLSIHKNLSLRFRYEHVRHRFLKLSRSEMAYMDLICSFTKKWKLFMRISYAQVETYDARIYTYESSIMGQYPIHNQYFSGLRSYILIKKKWKFIDCQLKYAVDFHQPENKSLEEQVLIGSGWDSIAGPFKHNFAFQLKYSIH